MTSRGSPLTAWQVLEQLGEVGGRVFPAAHRTYVGVQPNGPTLPHTRLLVSQNAAWGSRSWT